MARQIGPALQHGPGRPPIGPFALGGDRLGARPFEPVAADADAIFDGPCPAQHIIEPPILGGDDHHALGKLRMRPDDGLPGDGLKTELIDEIGDRPPIEGVCGGGGGEGEENSEGAGEPRP